MGVRVGVVVYDGLEGVGSYQPACFDRVVEWIRGVRRHGLGRGLASPFVAAILL